MTRPHWLLDAEEARRHPWKTRAFLFCGYTLLVPLVVAVAGGDWRGPEVAGVAVACGAASAVAREPWFRRRSRRADHGRHLGFGAVLAAQLAAVVVAIAVDSPYPLLLMIPAFALIMRR